MRSKSIVLLFLSAHSKTVSYMYFVGELMYERWSSCKALLSNFLPFTLAVYHRNKDIKPSKSKENNKLQLNLGLISMLFTIFHVVSSAFWILIEKLVLFCTTLWFFFIFIFLNQVGNVTLYLKTCCCTLNKSFPVGAGSAS